MRDDRQTWSTPTLRRSDVGSTAFGECGNEDFEFGEFSGFLRPS